MTPLVGAAAPWLALLLRRAMPGLAVLDLAALEGGGLHPWLAEARCGLARPGSASEAERALLAGFRVGRGGRLLGFDPPRDAALAAGAPEAWGAPAGRRLVALPTGAGSGAGADAAAWLAAGAMVLLRGAPAESPGGLRVMLLVGAPAPVERLDLLLPEGEGERLLPALEAAARGIAGAAAALRRVSPRLATLTLLAAAPPTEPAVLPAEHMVRDEGAGPGRLRLLLGGLPPRPLPLRLRFGPGLAAAPALFLDGARHEARAAQDQDGRLVLEAVIEAGPSGPVVLGLAGPGALLPDMLELGP